MKTALITVSQDRMARISPSYFWIKAMTCMALYVAHRLTFVNVSLIWKDM